MLPEARISRSNGRRLISGENSTDERIQPHDQPSHPRDSLQISRHSGVPTRNIQDPANRPFPLIARSDLPCESGHCSDAEPPIAPTTSPLLIFSSYSLVQQ